jgi:endonuclease YncB( thermonuclease family)
MRGRRGLQDSDTSAEVDTDPLPAPARHLVFGLALLAGLVSAVTAEQALPQAVRVIRVVDGDTMVVSTAESLTLKVRMQGIDAPECGMPFGPQAQRFLAQLVLGRTVKMSKTGRDRYGRTVATVTVDGQDVGFAMLQVGLAWHDRHYNRKSLSGTRTSDYAEAQQRAVQNFTGLWVDPHRVAPWLWRASGNQPRLRPRCTVGAPRGRTP